MRRLAGIVVALLTPFDEDGRVDRGALSSHIEFLVGCGVHGLFALGTTGEVFLLSADERRQIAEAVVEQVAGRVPVFIHVGAMPTSTACYLAAHAQAIGADGIGALTPYYFGVDQDGLKEYYRAIAGSVSAEFPVYLYNLPARAINDLLPGTVSELARIENIVGIKNSMSDMKRLCRLIEETPADFDVMQGDDELILPALMCGAAGAVSGNANVFPELLVALYRAVCEGEYERARNLQRWLSRLAGILRGGSDVAYLKQALAWRGVTHSHTRPPLLTLSGPAKALLRDDLDEIFDRLALPASWWRKR